MGRRKAGGGPEEWPDEGQRSGRSSFTLHPAMAGGGSKCPTSSRITPSPSHFNRFDVYLHPTAKRKIDSISALSLISWLLIVGEGDFCLSYLD